MANRQGAVLSVPRWALPPANPAPSPIDFSKLLDKLLPPPDGEDMMRLRTGVVDALNSDGTANVGVSGLVIPSVPVLAGAAIEDDQTVNLAVWRGGLLVLGATARSAADRDRPWGVLGRRQSTAATSSISTETKDGGCGDLPFTAVTGRRYCFSYRARMGASANATTGDVRIRDGGVSSPTNTSTQVAGSSYYVVVTGGAGQVNVVMDQLMDCPTDLAVGTHTVAAFYVKTVGGGNVDLTNATGQRRQLWVADVGPVN